MVIVDKISKSRSLCIVCVQLGARKVSVIRSSGVSAIPGVSNALKSVENDRDFVLFVISWVSASFLMSESYLCAVQQCTLDFANR